MPCYYDDEGELYCTEDDDTPPGYTPPPTGLDQYEQQALEENMLQGPGPGYASGATNRSLLYGNEAYGPSMTGEQTARYDEVLRLTGSKDLANFAVNSLAGKAYSKLKDVGGKAIDFAGSNQGLAGILGAILGAASKSPAYGGGARQGYAGPKQMTRTIAPAAVTGTPVARYAANGGLMQAYAQGGPVQMEDGGFVMTKRAVDGAGGPQGIQQLVPGARMIRGPGTGTSDDIPAVINGRRGQTPALLSNGEAYVPKPVVDGQGGAQQMYALMNKLQGRG